MKRIDKKITFGVIVGTRGFFNPKLAQAGRRQLERQLKKLGYDHVILPAAATEHGAIETYAHAKQCAQLFQSRRQDIDGVIVVLPNFGDELGVVQTLDLARLHVPVLVQACNDTLDALDVSARRDAFCGKISVCNNLVQYGIPFTDTTEHTCDIDSQVFAQDLDRFARVCRVVRGLRTARIGQIGTRPAAFQTVRFSEKLFQDSGITVIPVDLSDLFAAAQALDDKAAGVRRKISEIRAYGDIPAEVSKEQVARQARLSVALDQWMEANECDASAVQCWNSVQNNYGCAACLSMSLMGEHHRPSACEVDVAGAVSMYALLLASGQAPGFLDWNNNYGLEKDKCACTHCSNLPKAFVGRGVEISPLDLLGETLGRAKCFGAIKGHVAPGDMTYFRVSTDDSMGSIKTYLGEGRFTDDPFDMDGGIAVCKVDRLRDLLAYICRNGFEHHVAMTRTYCADVLEEAVSRYLGWDLYRHA
ncbi:MAG: fucose isomerase [Phycisphaerae bacterium]|nr:fucose isomerase [Phycisphaerae bacterium]